MRLLGFLELVIFDHWIRKQISAETVKTRFKFAIFPLNIDLHVFADPDAANLRHSEMPHRVAHRVPLRIEHRGLWHDDDFHFHRLTIFAADHATSAIQNLCFPDNLFGLFIVA